MKVKSESEVAQSCSTLRDPMDCSLPGSSVHRVFQARVLETGAITFSEISSKERLKAIPKIKFLKCFFSICTLESYDKISSNGKFGEGNGTPLQCSCLENPMDGGAW